MCACLICLCITLDSEQLEVTVAKMEEGVAINKGNLYREAKERSGAGDGDVTVVVKRATFAVSL